MLRKLSFLALALLLLAACGGGSESSAAASSRPTTTGGRGVVTTTTESGLGSAGSFVAEAFVAEGFTSDEADCLVIQFNDAYGEERFFEILMADETPAGFDTVMTSAVFNCLSAERLIEFGNPIEAESAQPEDEPRPEAEPAQPIAHLSCSDPAGDIRSEFSGWEPSIPVATGDVAELELGLETGVLSVSLTTHSVAPLSGGPGETPFVVRMYLVTGDEEGPVAYDVELMHSTGSGDPGTVTTVTTIDGQTGAFVSSETFDDVVLAPGSMVVTLPESAVAEVVRNDFWVEVRTEWGPDHPLSRTPLEPEWMLDSACNGPQLVAVSMDGADG